MKNIIKCSTMLLLSVLALALGACTEEYEYSGAKVSGEQVYFRNDISVASMAKDRDTVQVPINRIQSKGELQVPLQVTQVEGSKLTVPSSVTFADGQTQAYVVISYDPNAIDYGFSESLTLAVSDEQLTTLYGNSSVTLNVEMSPWVTMGQGLYNDGVLASFFGFDETRSSVTIQRNINTDGVYRVVTPYGPGTSFYQAYLTGAYIFTWVGNGNTSVVIDATDPEHVYMSEDMYPGMNIPLDGYGYMHIFSYVQMYLQQGMPLAQIKAEAPEFFGTLTDGIITLPGRGISCNFDDTLMEAGYLGGSIQVALPGYQFVDYSSSFEYTGRFTDTEGVDYAQGTITLGRDVASAKYAVAADGDDVNAIISALEDGSLPGTTITQSGSVSFSLTESGDYNVVIVTYGADGQAHGSSVNPFTFTLSGDAPATPEWVPLYNGTFTHNVMPNWIVDNEDNFVGNPLVGAKGFEETYASVIYQDINNPSNYKVDPYLSSEDGLEFTMDADGIISFNDVYTGWQNQYYGNLYVADAYLVLKELGQQLSAPSSFFDSQYNEFTFGTIYYYNMDTTHYGVAGGAYETFTVTSTTGVAPRKGMKANFRALLPKVAKAGAAHFKKMSGTKMQSAAIKGDLKRSVK